jgi:hypothetical protein
MYENDVELINYSEKSFVLRGKKTKEWSNRLREEGGKFNCMLTDPLTMKKFCGWLFKKSDKEKIDKILYEMMNDSIEIVNPEKSSLPSSSNLNTDVIIEDIPINNPIQYQKINFEIVIPQVGMKAKIYSNNNLLFTGKVLKVMKKNEMVTECLIKNDKNNHLLNTITCGIINFDWRILGTLIETNIIFE